MPLGSSLQAQLTDVVVWLEVFIHICYIQHSINIAGSGLQLESSSISEMCSLRATDTCSWSLVVMSILQRAYTFWESPWTAQFHWTNMSTTWWRLVTFTCRLFARSGNPLPAMLQMSWLALSLALVLTTVTLCFMACHEKTLISFTASSTVQHCVALVDGSKVHGSYVIPYTGCQFRARTDFSLATLSYKSQMTGQPDYLAAELRSYQPQLSLRSSSQELLTVPHCKTMLGRCRFLVAAPCIWNSLPLGLKLTHCMALKPV